MKKDKLIIFGEFTDWYSHNQHIVRILSSEYDLERIKTNRIYDRPGFIDLFFYFLININSTIKLPAHSNIYVGFNSKYDVILLRLVSAACFKKFHIIFEPLISQYETKIFIKPITNTRILLYYYKVFFYIVDLLSYHLSSVVMFDSFHNAKRFSKMFKISIQKYIVFPLVANSIFNNGLKNDDFWLTEDKINILWYGNPSKLHNIKRIVDLFNILDQNKYNITLICDYPIGNITNNIQHIRKDMYSIGLEEIAEILNKTHIVIGCLSSQFKCTEQLINKEHEGLISNTLLVTARGNKDMLNKDNSILIDSSMSILDINNLIDELYYDRHKMKRLAEKGYKEYMENYSDKKMLKILKRAIEGNN